MNDDRLKIYLNDHLALLVGETELAERCRGSNEQTDLGRFLGEMSGDLQDEQQLVRTLLDNVGGAESRIKQGVAWLAEKAGRLKLNDSLTEYSDLSRLVELEALFIAAHERRAFWESLDATRAADARFSEINFARQQRQAEQHCEALSQYRLDAARKAL